MQEYQGRVIDLHNDLLSYLAFSPKHSPHDAITGTSIEQIQKGGITCLGLAVYAATASGCERALLRAIGV